MTYDWDALPEMLENARKQLLNDLVATRSHDTSMYLRGQINAIDKILRLPEDAEEEMKESSDG